MVEKNKLNITLLLVVVFVLFLGARARQDKAMESPETQMDAPRYAQQGPYQVGTRSLKIEGENALALTAWYPALIEGTQGMQTRYPYEVKLGKPFGMVAIAADAGAAVPEALYDGSMEPYPLVVLSPGFSIGGSAYA